MPKIKTKRSAAKRFRFTGSGKIRRGHAFRTHLFTDKTRKRKRNLRSPGLVSPADHALVKRMLPNG